ncbi:hypothetical protein T484DRAFT_1794936 [Baffinella frigidus]|nr:hypothetical protein T484DRAFT_1794936 [Cryptophyta sp. CCMP2293]
MLEGAAAAQREGGGSAGQLSGDAILANEADDEGWVNLGRVKQVLRALQPGFDEDSYGFETMTTLVKSEPRHFECVTHAARGNFIRLVGGSSDAAA